LDRLNGFSSRYEYEQNAKIVCFFVTQNSFLLVLIVSKYSGRQRVPVDSFLHADDQTG
jgi:hypothetical protein